jgi:hypothetical protein
VLRINRLTKLLLVALAVLCAPHEVVADDTDAKFSTQILYQLCHSSALADEEACGLYLTGVADMMEQVALELNKPWATKAARSDLSIHAICTAGYSGAQLRQLFINWAEKNPIL